MERLRSALVVATLLLLGACGPRASGPPVSQARGVDAFHSIELRGAADVEVTVGDRNALVVEASPGVLEHVDTRVINGKLVVESHGGSGWFSTRGPVHVRATLPKLNSFQLNGAGRVSIAGLNGGATSIVMSGAGQIEAQGRLDTLTAHSNGAGEIDLSRVAATDAEVAVNGAGSLEVTATGRLDATVNGVGSIVYGGPPAVLNTSINGVGSIRAR
jgi:hypothetical protein